MTIASEVNRSGPYDGNGLTTAFGYGFKIYEADHLQVILTDTNGTESTLVHETDYSVTGVGEDGGGNAVLHEAPASGCKITLLLAVPFKQETDLENQGAYYAETVERALDINVMMLQQLKERSQRALTIPASADPTSLDQLLSYVLAIGDHMTAVQIVASVSQYLDDIATVADDIPAVSGLTQTTVEKAAEASQSAVAANSSAALAAAYADNPEDAPIPGAGGLFSAFHWYRKSLGIYTAIANDLAGWIHAAAAKPLLAGDDELAIRDSASGTLRRITLTDFWAQAKWRTHGIGEIYFVNTALPGVDIPPSDTADTIWIELTAGLTGPGQFNQGKLRAEAVTGSAPLIDAVATVDIASSPLYNVNIHLLNTEGRIIRPSAVAGITQNDAFQGHQFSGLLANLSSAVPNGTNIALTTSNSISAPMTGPVADARMTSVVSDGLNGMPRTANETRMKNIGVKAYMRIK